MSDKKETYIKVPSALMDVIIKKLLETTMVVKEGINLISTIKNLEKITD